MTTTRAIELLREVARIPECGKMNLSTVKGYLGELLVKELLEAEGRTVDHLGNQSGYDLRFRHQGTEVRVDVKTSLFKDEFKWGFEYWGWALQQESKQKPITATHFICVGCSNQLEVQALFVVRASEVARFPRGERQFKKVKHGLVLSPLPQPTGVSEPKDEMYKVSQLLLTQGVVKQVLATSSLSDACG